MRSMDVHASKEIAYIRTLYAHGKYAEAWASLVNNRFVIPPYKRTEIAEAILSKWTPETNISKNVIIDLGFK